MPGEAAGIGLMPQKLKLGDAEPPMARLIARAQAGEAEAFDQLMIAHQHRVVSIAWRILGSREEARDAAQEAFLRVYKHLHKFDLDRDFSGWLYRIVVNVCHDLARKRGRQNWSEEVGDLSNLPSGENLESAAMLAQEQAMVLRALSSLSRKERAALVLRDFEGIATEEVARILGSSPTTVRSQISSARTKIKNFRDRLLKVKI
jgi:RNA polymerase sigma-70 factor (ECF subfamily)